MNPPSSSTNDSAPTVGSAMGGGGGLTSWISTRTRVAELIFDATRAASLQMQFDGSTQALCVQMQEGRSLELFEQVLLVRARSVNILEEQWVVGNAVTLWFAKRDGFYAFRTEIVSQDRDALVLAMPTGVLRHCRRGQRRFRLPSGVTASLMVALADGAWHETAGFNDISALGLSTVLPEGLAMEAGSVIRFRLQLFQDRQLEINGLVRHAQPERDGTITVGIEFVGTSNTARLAIERYLMKSKAVPLPDVATSAIPPLPESMRIRLSRLQRADKA